MNSTNTAVETDGDGDGRAHDADGLLAVAEACLTGAPVLIVIGPEPDHPEPYAPRVLPIGAFDKLSPSQRLLFLGQVQAELRDLVDYDPTEPWEIEGEVDHSQSPVPIRKWEARLKLGEAVPMIRAASAVEYLASRLHQFGRELEQVRFDHSGLSGLRERFAERLSLLDLTVDVLDREAEAAAAEAGLAFFPGL